MGKKILIISIIIGALILIGLTSSFSYWIGQKSMEVKSEIAVPNPLESKVIQNWSANAIGEMTEIINHNLTLSQDGEIFTITLLEKAGICSMYIEEGERKIEDIQFEDIKIGDRVNITLGVNSEGNMVGNFVTVLK